MLNDLSVWDANEASLLDEITDQDYAAVSGACSTNTFTLSDRYGNDGYMCTLTVECVKWCP